MCMTDLCNSTILLRDNASNDLEAQTCSTLALGRGGGDSRPKNIILDGMGSATGSAFAFTGASINWIGDSTWVQLESFLQLLLPDRTHPCLAGSRSSCTCTSNHTWSPGWSRSNDVIICERRNHRKLVSTRSYQTKCKMIQWDSQRSKLTQYFLRHRFFLHRHPSSASRVRGSNASGRRTKICWIVLMRIPFGLEFPSVFLQPLQAHKLGSQVYMGVRRIEKTKYEPTFS